MGLRGFFDALTKTAAQPDKDFGALVRQRRRKRGLPVAPAGKVLPFVPTISHGDLAKREALDVAAENLIEDEANGDELRRARVQLVERRLSEAFMALEEAESREHISAWKRRRLDDAFARELNTYERLKKRGDE